MTIKTKFIYFLGLVVLFVILHFSLQNCTRPETYSIELEEDMVMPNEGVILSKGTVLYSSAVSDMDSTDWGNHAFYKIYISFDNASNALLNSRTE